jgi:hypothetical protein
VEPVRVTRLTAKLGEVDLEKWRDGDREEMLKEASIEEKIRLRKKKKSKERAEQERRREAVQPRRKKMRLEGEIVTKESEREKRRVQTTPAQKRKVGGVAKAQPGKRRKTESNIRDYISCKRWKMDEKEEARQDKDKMEKEGEEVEE